jgi:hypothetical protein
LIVDSVLGVSGERHYRDVEIITDRARLASRIEVEAVVSRTPIRPTRHVRMVRVLGLLDAGATVWPVVAPANLTGSPMDLRR